MNGKPLITASSLVLGLTLLAACEGGGGVCSPGQKRCDQDMLVTCRADGSGQDSTTCPYGCQENACRACAPSSKRCDGNVLYTCKADGKGWDFQLCDHGCVATACRSDVCTANSKRCVSNNLETCKPDGSGYTSQLCDHGCQNNACLPASCTPDDKMCGEANQVLLTCAANGLGYESQACPYGCNPNATPPACKDPACNATEKRCGGTNNLTIEKCNADRTGWESTGTVCTDQCDNGACVYTTCEPLAKFCVGDAIHQCNADGSDQEYRETCAQGCVQETTTIALCGVCRNNAKRCRENTLQICNQPLVGWVDLIACPQGQECHNGACSSVLTLSGAPAANNAALVNAVVQCWNANHGVNSDVMCRAIDARNLTANLVESEVKSWLCASQGNPPAGITDFNAAWAIFACSLTDFWDDVDWKSGDIVAGTDRKFCLWYDTHWGDEIFIEHCTNF